MSIQDEAARVIERRKWQAMSDAAWYGREIKCGSDDIARALADAGLLAPELPEPDWTGGVTTWETSHGDIELISGEMIDTPGAYMTTHEAREYAHALLAAAKYAEEEK